MGTFMVASGDNLCPLLRLHSTPHLPRMKARAQGRVAPGRFLSRDQVTSHLLIHGVAGGPSTPTPLPPVFSPFFPSFLPSFLCARLQYTDRTVPRSWRCTHDALTFLCSPPLLPSSISWPPFHLQKFCLSDPWCLSLLLLFNLFLLWFLYSDTRLSQFIQVHLRTPRCGERNMLFPIRK